MLAKIVQPLLFVLVALTTSALTLFLKSGTDATALETIGVVSRWGVPIYFRTTAPGLTWAQFDGPRFLLNSILWLVAWCFIAMIFRRVKRGGDNPRIQ